MNKTFFVYLALIFFTACHQEKNQILTIATAANMQFVMEALTTSFTQETGVECQAIIGSSGKLTAQIKEGAPFDLFISADMKYPSELSKSGFTLKAPEIYAYGRLVLWSMDDEITPALDRLQNEDIKHIALANPKTAPYGVAAIEVLQHYGIYKNVESKLVYGESIAQTNQFITSNAAELGFTAKSVVFSDRIKGRGRWIEIDSSAYTPIAQGVVILSHSKKRLPQAQLFYKFLFSDQAKEILNNFGYDVKD